MGGASAMVVEGRSWIRDDTGTSGQPAQITGVAEEANYTMTSASEVVVICAGAADNGQRFEDGDTEEGCATLSHRVVGTTSWTTTGTGSTANGPYITGTTVLTHNNVVTSDRQVTSQSNASGTFPTGGAVASLSLIHI